LTTKLFPLSATQSFADWKLRHELDQAQEELLQLLPFHGKDDPLRTSKVIKTDVGHGNYINEFMIMPKKADESKLNHFVLIHGYGAGLGFYLKNFDEISKKNNWCIHALDLLGYGCSSRPHFDKQIPLEAYFIDSLEAWRQQRGIDDMLMCSHSLGAYMSVLYTMKNPQRVKKLLCISPAGIYRPPAPPGEIPVWFDWLWEQNVSPFSLVRNAGPFGSMITSGWTSRRFAKLTDLERQRLHKYTYAIFNARGSGEYYMPQVLGAGGVPKIPLVDRVHEITCDVSWVYGDEDWMPKEGGVQCTKIIKQNTPFDSEFKLMENCGHHIYLDNYNKFNEYILQEMNKYEEKYKTK
jgi:cardiolipin-specific phospholipase